MADKFDDAYWSVVASIDAPREMLLGLLPDLRAAYVEGNPRRMHEAVERHLPEGGWRWPLYEVPARDRDEECRREEIRAARKCDLSDFLTCMHIPALRQLHASHAPSGSKSPGRGKAEIIPALLALLDLRQQKDLLARLRAEALAELAEPYPLDYQEMAVLLCRRISTVIHAVERYEQLSDPDLLSLRPRWRFHWVEGGAKECRKFNGKALSVAEARQAFPRIPCDCLECGCYLEAAKGPSQKSQTRRVAPRYY